MAAGRLVHDAYVYSSDEEFLAGALPFVQAGLAQGEPILAAPKPANVRLLCAHLGDDAGAVQWAPDAEAHKPGERLSLFLRFIGDSTAAGARRVRLLGEPPWPDGSPAGVTEWKRYESYLNLALAPHAVWLVCPYDARALPRGILADACCTHPHVGYGGGRAASPDYVEPARFSRELDRREPLAPVPPDAVACPSLELAAVRRFVLEHAVAAGLAPDRAYDLEIAANEIATNALVHAGGIWHVRMWPEARELVCEVADGGRGIADPFAGLSEPGHGHVGGRGLTIARRLCTTVEVRAAEVGTVVRLHMTRM